MAAEIGIMVPHPPIIMKEVGRGEEKKISATDAAYREAAKRVADTDPETLIIISPHTVLYGDYFHVSGGEGAHGDMGKFNAPEVSFDVKYDEELISYIDGTAHETGFPAGTLGETMPELDHGTMVPLYYLLPLMPDVKIVRVGLSGMSYEEHYSMGLVIKHAVEKTGRRVAVIGSGDLSHKQKEDGPYGLVPEGPEYDEKIMDVMGRAAFGELLTFDEKFCDKAAECGHKSFIIMAGIFNGRDVKAEILSHEATFGVGYGVGIFTPGELNEDRRFLRKIHDIREAELAVSRKKESPWVQLARETVETFINTHEIPDYKERDYGSEKLNSEFHDRKAGVFVSIHKHGALRGCIGTFLPTTDCIADEIVQNAIGASVRDPRFMPIRGDELSSLEISVDVLETPESVSDRSALDPKIYGVIVTSGSKRGLLLPDLPGVDTVEEQLSIACEKAGIDTSENYEIERFKVVRHL